MAYKLSKDDWALISSVDERFSDRDIKYRFNQCAKTKAEDRYDMVVELTKYTERAYCPQMFVPKEFWSYIYDHHENMKKIAAHLGFNQKTVDMCGVHDIAEGLTTDFSPRDIVKNGKRQEEEFLIPEEKKAGLVFVENPITKEEKIQLELIATKLTLEFKPYLRQCWLEYEDRQTQESFNTKNIDIYELVTDSNRIELKAPQCAIYFNNLWRTMSKSLIGSEPDTVVAELVGDRTAIQNGKAPQSGIFKTVFPKI